MRRSPGSALRAACLIALLGLLGACASDAPKPRPLEPVAAARTDKLVWSVRGADVPSPLRPAAAEGTVVVVSGNGVVRAVDATSGKLLWRADVDRRVTAAAGFDGRRVALVTDDNELRILERDKPTWHAKLATRVVTPPLVAGDRVFVQGIDRSIQAYDAVDGRKLWEWPRSGDALTLSQPGVLQPLGDVLFAGAGTRLLALDPLKGVPLKDWVVAQTRGVNEVERLADLVGPAYRDSEGLCVRAYQAAVTCLEAASGRIAWTRPVSGHAGLAGAEGSVVGVDAVGRLKAWGRRDGRDLWTSESLMYRTLSAPATTGSAVVVGDEAGRLHFFDLASGKPVLRLNTDGGAISAPPLRVGSTLVVVTAKGGIHGVRAD